MARPVVAVTSLGGTITMTPADRPDGLIPSLTAAQLLRSVPSLSLTAEVRTETLFTKPGASLTFADVLLAQKHARQAVAAGAAGVVLVQGTDTLEESSYLLDLFWNLPEPLILTGAMRSPAYPGADGPANLHASVVTAVTPDSREQGVLVALNDEVHAAARVRKCDSTAPNAFSSAPFGPLARIHEGNVVYGNRLRRPPALPRIERRHNPRVALLETFLGDEGELLKLVIEAQYDGIVIAAFGAGHVSAAMATMVSKASGQVPVVLASRTGAGSLLAETYGFPGSERDLLRRGAISAGWLDPRKARVLLWSQLALGHSIEQIRVDFGFRAGTRVPSRRN